MNKRIIQNNETCVSKYLDKRFESALSRFNCDKAASLMKHLNWVWRFKEDGSYRIPISSEIKSTILEVYEELKTTICEAAESHSSKGMPLYLYGAKGGFKVAVALYKKNEYVDIFDITAYEQAWISIEFVAMGIEEF